MIAFILAAGKGSRLAALGMNIPKPMIQYKDKPILCHNIDLCINAGISKIIINLHNLPKVISTWVGNGSRWNIPIEYIFEEELCGTSGAIDNAKKLFSEADILIIYGDNYTEIDIQELIKKHNNHPESLGTIAFHYREDVSHSGVAEFDANGFVTTFIEKPAPGVTNSHWVNAGVYIFRSTLLKYLPNGFSDFGKDIFPLLLKKGIKLLGVCQQNKVVAFDTPEMYSKNIKYGIS